MTSKTQRIHSLRPLVLLAALGLSAVAWLALPGCGGSSSSSDGAAAAGPTQFRVTIQWPDESSDSRLLPSASNSVTIDIVNTDNSLNLSQTVARPPDPATTTTATFNQPFTVGDMLTVTAAAYPSTDGSGTAQAGATLQVPVPQQDAPLAIDLTMASTVATFAIDPALDALEVGEIVNLSAVAKDANGAVVLLKEGLFTWTLASGDNQYAALIGTAGQSNTSSTNRLQANAPTPANTTATVLCNVQQQFQVPASDLQAEAEFTIDQSLSLLAGTPEDAGSLGGMDTRAKAILANGTVVGTASLGDGNHAFLKAIGGAIQDLGNAGANVEAIVDCNDSLVAVGQIRNQGVKGVKVDLTQGALPIENSVVVLTGPNGEAISPNCINNDVLIGGSMNTTNGGVHAIVQDANGTTTDIHDAAGLSSTASSQITALNNNGLAAGSFSDPVNGTFDPQPFLYDLVNSIFTTLDRGPFGGGVEAITDQGLLAGFTFNGSSAGIATIWISPQGDRIILGSVGANDPFAATSILAANGDGTIFVGEGIDANNGNHGVVFYRSDNSVHELDEGFPMTAQFPFVRYFQGVDINASNQIAATVILDENGGGFPSLGAAFLNPTN